LTNQTVEAMLRGGVPVPTILTAIKTAENIQICLNPRGNIFQYICYQAGWLGGANVGLPDRLSAIPPRSKRHNRVWCALVYSGVMSTTIIGAEAIRRSISLPAEMAETLERIAAARHVSANRAIIDLLSDAITAYEQRRAIFLELADRFQKSTDPAETERLRDELANMTFGH
jgi:hypothetical protein